MIIDEMRVDLSRAFDWRSEGTLPDRRAVIGVKRENLVRHCCDQHEIACLTASQTDTGHDQRLRLGASAVSLQRQREQSLDAAATNCRSCQHAFTCVCAISAVIVRAREDRNSRAREISWLEVEVMPSSKPTPQFAARFMRNWQYKTKALSQHTHSALHVILRDE